MVLGYRITRYRYLFQIASDNLNFTPPTFDHYTTPIISGFEFQFNWGFRMAENDAELGYQLQAERILSQRRSLKEIYRNPIHFCLQTVSKPRIITQPCWRSGRWKSLT
jgi:hypothetical protein